MGSWLGRFFLVRKHEARPLAYFFALFFLLGCGMALGRVTADALFFKRYGIEYLPVMYIVVSAVLCLTSILYSAFADRLPAERFFNYLLLSLIAILLGNWLLIADTDITLAYPLYFVVYEIASEVLLVHAALYLGQNLETQQAKRLSPIIMAGSQSGVIVGGLFVAGSSQSIGVQNILLIWCLFLTVTLFLMAAWHKLRGASPYFHPSRRSADRLGQAVNEVRQGLRFMRTSALLRALSFALFFMVVTFYVLCYSVNRIYTATFQSEESLTMFFGILTAANSVIALLLQLFVTNRMLQRFGAKRVNLIFPVTSLMSYVALFISFTFPSALFGSFNKDALLNAFRNPVRNLFFHALPVNMQGRARATSIIVVLPLALTTGGLLLWLMQRMGDPVYFLVLGMGAAACYLYYSHRVSSAYGAEMITSLRQKLFVPEQHGNGSAGDNGDTLFDELARGIRHKDNRLTLDFARMLVQAFPERAVELILERLDDVDNATRDQLFKLLASANPAELQDYLWRRRADPDRHLRATALKTLFALGSEAAQSLPGPALDSGNPRLQVAGIYGALSYPDHPLASRARNCWQELLQSEQTGARLAVLELLELLQGSPETAHLHDHYQALVLTLLHQDSARVSDRVLASLRYWPAATFPQLDPRIEQLFRRGAPPLRVACLQQCRLMTQPARESLIAEALEDSNPEVRQAAVAAIFETFTEPVACLTAWLTSENRGSPRAQHAMLLGLQTSDAPRDVMERIALARAQDAQHLFQALQLLTGETSVNNSAMQLMRHALAEKLQQLVELVLLAMQSMEFKEDLDVVRAGIKSRDPRAVASALEVLHTMKKQALARMLCDILDGHAPVRLHAGKAPFTDAGSVLRWCEQRLDPWLQACATQALKSFA